MRRVAFSAAGWVLGLGCVPETGGLGLDEGGSSTSAAAESSSSGAMVEDETTAGAATGGASTEGPATEGPATEGSTTGSESACGNGVTDEDETCDDANTDELDGCTSTCEPGPLGLEFGPIMETPDAFGGWVAQAFDVVTDCAPHEVLVGIRGTFSDYFQYFVLAEVQGVCAPLELANAVPTSLAFGSPVGLDLHGSVPGPTSEGFDSLCPEGSVASGLLGAEGQYTDMISTVCRSLSLTSGVDAIELGDPVELPPFGMIQPVESRIDCPVGMVATGLRIQGDAVYATRFHLRCRALDVQLP